MRDIVILGGGVAVEHPPLLIGAGRPVDRARLADAGVPLPDAVRSGSAGEAGVRLSR